MRRRFSPLLISSAPFALLSATVAGCTAASADGSSRWLSVARDSTYAIAIDTTRIERRMGGQWWLVWYRTDHAQTRHHKGEPFDREVVQSYLRCADLSFKIVSVDMSLGANRPIAEQRLTPDEIAIQPWRQVERGTIEEAAGRAACDFARRQYAARWR